MSFNNPYRLCFFHNRYWFSSIRPEIGLYRFRFEVSGFDLEQLRKMVLEYWGGEFRTAP